MPAATNGSISTQVSDIGPQIICVKKVEYSRELVTHKKYTLCGPSFKLDLSIEPKMPDPQTSDHGLTANKNRGFLVANCWF